MIELIKYDGEKVDYSRYSLSSEDVHVDTMIREQRLRISKNMISTKFIPYDDDPMHNNGFPGFLAFKSNFDEFVFTSLMMLGTTLDDAKKNYNLLLDYGYNVRFLKAPELDPAVFKLDNSAFPELMNTNSNVHEELVPMVYHVIKTYQDSVRNQIFEIEYGKAYTAYMMTPEHRAHIKQAIKERAERGEPVGRPEKSRSYNKKAIEIMNAILDENVTFGGKLYDVTIMENHDFTKTSYYKYKKELLEDRAKMSHLSMDDFKSYEKKVIAAKGRKGRR